MSETLTYQPETTTETITDNLTEEEQSSLEVGEKLVAEQEQLLAGKYKSAEELEKAYVELQKKLGNKEESEDTEKVSKEDESETESELSENASLINSASEEYFSNGNKLSDETMAKFSSLSTQDLIKAYMEVQSKAEPAPEQAAPAELSESDINQIKNSAGGDKAYANIVNWAKSNLDAKQITAFDEVINTGSVQAIQLAVSGLKAEYDNANGVEGRMVTGKTAPNNGDVFRSQAELVRAMNDSRYDSDPAYRQDVIEKLERSDLEF
tara:strand:- start:61 stop:861 length:801 start_codon:yes stop_codon:yes gene_type:complete